MTPKKFTVFTGKIKAGPKCPTFIRGDPYMEKTSDVAATAFLAKKIGGKFGLKMA